MTRQGYETPHGLCHQAQEFLGAAERVCDSDGVPDFLFPFYYLIGHALELIFKAALLHDGTSLKDLKTKYGHDLILMQQAFLESTQWQLVEISDLDLALISAMNTDYVSKRLEYRQKDHSYRLPLPDMIYGAAQNLIKEISDVIG